MTPPARDQDLPRAGATALHGGVSFRGRHPGQADRSASTGRAPWLYFTEHKGRKRAPRTTPFRCRRSRRR